MSQQVSDPAGSACAIPFLDMLHSRLMSRAIDATRDDDSAETKARRTRVASLELEQLPYNLLAAHDSLRRLEELLRNLATLGTSPLPFSAGTVMGLNTEQTWPIAWTVDQFLDCMRRAQNALTRYVARVVGVSLPLSLNDLMHKLASDKCKLPSEISTLLTSYWNGHGRALKDYRDLAQHFVVVASDPYLRIEPNGVVTVRLLLPSKPNEKALDKIAYDAPFVPIGDYCRSEFVELFRVAYLLSYVLLKHAGISDQFTFSLIRHPIPLRRPGGFAAVPADDLDDLLWATRRSAKERATAEYGKLEG